MCVENSQLGWELDSESSGKEREEQFAWGRGSPGVVVANGWA